MTARPYQQLRVDELDKLSTSEEYPASLAV